MTQYIVAILPPATERVASLSHEFPPEPIAPADKRELLEFITLCIECGATGFRLDERDFPVESSMGTWEEPARRMRRRC